MAYEKSLPKNHIIAAVAVGSALLLGSLHFVFRSYFNSVTTDHVAREVLSVKVWNVDGMKADADARLANGAVPIQAAMAKLAKGERPSDIAPQLEEESLDALTGWTTAPSADKDAVASAKGAHARWRYTQAEARLAAARGQDPKPTAEELQKLEAALAARKSELDALGVAVPAPEAQAEAPPVPSAADPNSASSGQRRMFAPPPGAHAPDGAHH
jgi:hypothetical protein